ncbi:response regulator transcription factor [Acidovorax sp. NCPPB 2350]|nr:response regulator transcription factor [Acidovorax sp. NCPPB 2350]
MSRIALVEDHARLAHLIHGALQAAGIGADVFHDMEGAWMAMRDIDYRAAVIDRGLPDGDGLSLVKRLRAAGKATPCLILTARDALHDRVEGLESGADDYLTKPFPMEEFIARVRALLRRPAILQSLQPSFGDIHLQPEHGLLVCRDEQITLAPAEMQIMLCLVRQEGRTVRRSALEAVAWGMGEAVTPNALDVALHRLRRKLVAVESTLQIVNVRTHGYVLRETALAG